mgnify:CR=1 FL=1
MLYLLRMTRLAALRVRLRNAAFAALFLTFQFWAELTYGSFLLLFVAIVFVWQMLSQRKAVLRDEVNLYTDLLEKNGGAGTALDRRLGSLRLDWEVGGYTITSLTGPTVPLALSVTRAPTASRVDVVPRSSSSTQPLSCPTRLRNR